MQIEGYKITNRLIPTIQLVFVVLFLVIVIVKIYGGKQSDSIDVFSPDSLSFNVIYSDKSTYLLPINWGDEYIVVVLNMLYKQYKNASYNDSSQTTKHVGDYRFCTYQSTEWEMTDCGNPSHYNQKIWTHKKPTFQGFMEWLQALEEQK